MSHKEAKYKKKAWIMGKREHCDNCPALAARGWVDIDYKYMVNGREAVPGNGATHCLTNCGCRLEFRKK